MEQRRQITMRVPVDLSQTLPMQTFGSGFTPVLKVIGRIATDGAKENPVR